MEELLHYSNVVTNFTSINYDSFIFDLVKQNIQLPVSVSKKKFSKMQPSSLGAGKHVPDCRVSTALLFVTAY